ncbi:hypothetical protein [Streptomyces carpaticus]|uniref:hypothetical protein n=1 Tax=Streptomyces carpaticus TaxID=285558 RepID=UPI0031F8AE83
MEQHSQAPKTTPSSHRMSEQLRCGRPRLFSQSMTPRNPVGSALLRQLAVETPPKNHLRELRSLLGASVRVQDISVFHANSAQR